MLYLSILQRINKLNKEELPRHLEVSQLLQFTSIKRLHKYLKDTSMLNLTSNLPLQPNMLNTLLYKKMTRNNSAQTSMFQILILSQNARIFLLLEQVNRNLAALNIHRNNLQKMIHSN